MLQASTKTAFPAAATSMTFALSAASRAVIMLAEIAELDPKEKLITFRVCSGWHKGMGGSWQALGMARG
jgi:hypothetical protein